MEAFLYQQHQSFFLDPAAIDNYMNPSSPIEILLPHHNQAAAAGGGEVSNASSCFTSYNSTPTSSLDAVPPPHEADQPQLSADKKRKQSDGSCLSTGQSKVAKESKSRRKKDNGALKPKATKQVVKATKNHEEPPSGYIHVRARRGQATDSHSLAERVRRERISERMKKLQGLVPGCDKLIGKAFVLDEIINYVQSLQNQVEFLSMKLASVNPILYDFGGDFEDYMRQPEGMRSISQAMPSVIQNSHIPPTAFDGSATTSLQQVIDPAAPFPLHEQGTSQGSGSFLMQVELNNMCSFQ